MCGCAEVAAPSDGARRIHLYHPLELPQDLGASPTCAARARASCPSNRSLIGVGESQQEQRQSGSSHTSRVGACFKICRDGRDDKSPSVFMRTALNCLDPRAAPEQDQLRHEQLKCLVAHDCASENSSE